MRKVLGGTGALIATALVTLVAGNLGAQASSLKGSPQSVDSMYSVAVRNEYAFLKTSSAVNTALSNGKLVRLTGNSNYELDSEVQYPFVMPVVRTFVERFGEQYRAGCGERLVVTGATRPLDMKLANGSPLSVHPTGMAVDLRSRAISSKCLKWIRPALKKLEETGVIEATEENRPHHFHVAVFPTSYTKYLIAQGVTPQINARVTAIAFKPTVVSYQVRTGDSLWGIAARHDTTVKAILELNKMQSDSIWPGQVLLVPKAN